MIEITNKSEGPVVINIDFEGRQSLPQAELLPGEAYSVDVFPGRTISITDPREAGHANTEHGL